MKKIVYIMVALSAVAFASPDDGLIMTLFTSSDDQIERTKDMAKGAIEGDRVEVYKTFVSCIAEFKNSKVGKALVEDKATQDDILKKIRKSCEFQVKNWEREHLIWSKEVFSK